MIDSYLLDEKDWDEDKAWDDDEDDNFIDEEPEDKWED